MNLRKDSIFNTIGNFAYLGALWLMSVLVVRLGSFEMAGYYSLALTSSNIYIAIASYTARLYYAADIREEYSDRQYFIMRCITTFASLLLCFLVSVLAGYSSFSVLIILSFYFFKVFEMLSDILFGAMQRHGRLYFAGYSMVIKSCLVLVVFIAALKLNDNLVFTFLAITVVAALVFFAVDLPYVRRLGVSYRNWKKEDWACAVMLLKVCFPLLLVGICYNVIPSVPRLVFERLYSPDEFGIYSSLSAVTVLISTAVNCVTVPIIPVLTRDFQQRNIRGFRKSVGLLLGLTVGIGAAALLLTRLCGEPVLVFLFGDRIAGYLSVFYCIIAATILTSVVICLNGALTAAGRQTLVLYGNIPGLLISVFLSYAFCRRWYMMGVAFVLILAQAVDALVLGVMIHRVLKSCESEKLPD